MSPFLFYFTVCVWEGERTAVRTKFSPSIVWDSGRELRFLELGGKHLLPTEPFCWPSLFEGALCDLCFCVVIAQWCSFFNKGVSISTTLLFHPTCRRSWKLSSSFTPSKNRNKKYFISGHHFSPCFLAIELWSTVRAKSICKKCATSIKNDSCSSGMVSLFTMWVC